MDKEKFSKDLKEILELVKLCPQNLQEKCFEVLLNNLLNSIKSGGHQSVTPTAVDVGLNGGHGSFLPSEINKRLRAFAGQHQFSEAEILKVFNVEENGNVSVEVTDLKSKKIAQQQRRIHQR